MLPQAQLWKNCTLAQWVHADHRSSVNTSSVLSPFPTEGEIYTSHLTHKPAHHWGVGGNRSTRGNPRDHGEFGKLDTGQDWTDVAGVLGQQYHPLWHCGILDSCLTMWRITGCKSYLQATRSQPASGTWAIRPYQDRTSDLIKIWAVEASKIRVANSITRVGNMLTHTCSVWR